MNSTEAEIDADVDTPLFEFHALPNELKVKIVRSIPEEEPKTFTTLLRVSKATREVCLASRHRVVRNVREIVNTEVSVLLGQASQPSIQRGIDVVVDVQSERVPLSIIWQSYVRLHATIISHECFLDNMHAMQICRLMDVQGMTAETMRTTSDVTCDSGLLQNILTICGATNWESAINIPKHVLRHLSLDTCVFMSTDCDDQTLLTFHCSNITIFNKNPRVPSQITDQGINLFIKQWLSGERELESFEFGWTLSNRNLPAVLDGLNANPIWTEALHDQSLLRDYRMDHIREMMQVSQMTETYSIFKSSDIHNFRIIEIGEDFIRIEQGIGEAEKIYRFEETILLNEPLRE